MRFTSFLLLTLAALGGAVPDASAADSGIQLGNASVRPESVAPGDSINVSAVLQNSSNEDWDASRYQVQVELLSSDGHLASKTNPLTIDSPIATGKSTTLRIKDIRVASELSGTCSLRVLVLQDGKIAVKGNRIFFDIAAAAPEPSGTPDQSNYGRAEPPLTPQPHEPSAEKTTIRGGTLNLDINYPGVGARYFLSDRTALEGRAQLNKGNLIAGPRLYWYPPLLPADGKFSPYLCAEGDYVSFKDAAVNGRGWAAGAFAGIEYSLGRSFSLQVDTGGGYFSIKDKGAPLTQNGLEFILDFGVNYYLLSGAPSMREPN